MEPTSNTVGVPLVIVAAEKSRFLEPYKVQATLASWREGLAGHAVLAGLVAYAAHALPLVDPQGDPELVVRAYEEAPILDGAPNPVAALREAADMIADYSNALTRPRLVVLLWSLKSRPRHLLRILANYIESLGAGLLVVAYTAKRRPWLPRYFPGARIVEVDPMRPSRGSQAILDALRPWEGLGS